MGNLVANIKKFILNKNSVTILGVFACIIILYIGYTIRINQKVKFISVLYATQEIQSNTQITEEMFSTIKVNSDLLNKSPNIARSAKDIQDANGEFFYVNFDSTIPANSLIYKDMLIAKDDKPDSKLAKVKKGYQYEILEVDMESTLGNAISPGASIDIFAYIDGTEKMYGRLYRNVEVVDVVNRDWVTTSGNKEEDPDYLIILVKEEDYRLLEQAKRLREIELIPAPNNYSFEESGKETTISSIDLQLYITDKYSTITEE